MATKKKMLQAAAGSATGGAGLDVNEVFSTYLYTGNGSTQTITNGIDLAGEGGLVWIKHRDSATQHRLFDTERGANISLTTSDTSANDTLSGALTSFNSDGFTLGSHGNVNANNYDLASWTFRKAPKFFDVVTYTGDGTTNRTLSHSLGADVGSVFVKPTNAAPTQWYVYHKATGNGQLLELNDVTQAISANVWGNTTPTTTGVTINGATNVSGRTYVAYLFAHNDGDGEFGPDGDQDIIKCGSYTGTGVASNPVDVNLGFEPQWVLVKNASNSQDWYIVDTMRGFTTDDQNDVVLRPNLSNADSTFTRVIAPTPTGFKITSDYNEFNQSGNTFIYIAIRRGPLAPPESGTEVFDVQFNGGNDPSKAPVYQSGFVTDMSIVGLRTGGSVNYPYTGNRLMGIQTLETHNTDAEESGGASFQWDFMNGFIDGVPSVITDTQIAWMWKRAPGFFDVVAYSGNAVAGRTVSHNLGVAPEMIWVKKRNAVRSWIAYHSGIGSGKFLELDNTSAAGTVSTVWYDTDPTSTNFTVGTNSSVNQVPDTYIAYLFATLPGISKVGSYTGNSTGNASGITQTIDCGFTSGARFVLIKKTNGTGSWAVFDTERGIISGNDPYLELNETTAESTVTDAIDPHSSGFTLTSSTLFNANGDTFIFYAIA